MSTSVYKDIATLELTSIVWVCVLGRWLIATFQMNTESQRWRSQMPNHFCVVVEPRPLIYEKTSLVGRLWNIYVLKIYDICIVYMILLIYVCELSTYRDNNECHLFLFQINIIGLKIHMHCVYYVSNIFMLTLIVSPYGDNN